MDFNKEKGNGLDDIRACLGSVYLFRGRHG